MYSELPGPGTATGSKPAKHDETTVTKSPSDYGILGSRTGASGHSRRTQSHSGGNPPVIGGDKRRPGPAPSSAPDFTDLCGVDTHVFDVTVTFVDTLLTLDRHVDMWRSLMSSSWRRVVDVGRDKKPRHLLKSNFS